MLSKEERTLIPRWSKEGNISVRCIGKRLGVSRNTVRRWLRQSDPQYGPKSEAGTFLQKNSEEIKELYAQCEQRCPPLQRCIREKHGIEIPLRMLQRFCRPLRKEWRRQTYLEDMVQRFETAPGQHLQVDFGEKDVLMNGVPVRLHFFVCKLGFSRRIFVKAYMNETQEAWLDGMESAFRYFGGLPRCIVCDNASSLVRNHYAKDTSQRFTERFHYFLTYYGIKGIATAVQHPRSKGKVESSVKYVKGNALVGVDKPDLTAWNLWLESWCREESDSRKLNTVFTGPDTPQARWELEKQELRPCTLRKIAGVFVETRKVTRDGLIRIENQHYRLDDALIGQDVTVQYDEKTINVRHGGKNVATLDKAKDVFNPEVQETSTESVQEEAIEKQLEQLKQDPHWQQLRSSNNEINRSVADYDAVVFNADSETKGNA